jgi:hypothetical protein
MFIQSTIAIGRNKIYSGDQTVSRRPPFPPQSVHITVPNPLQSLHVCQPGETLPLPPHLKHVFLPLLQNVHFFHICLLDMTRIPLGIDA